MTQFVMVIMALNADVYLAWNDSVVVPFKAQGTDKCQHDVGCM